MRTDSGGGPLERLEHKDLDSVSNRADWEQRKDTSFSVSGGGRVVGRREGEGGREGD